MLPRLGPEVNFARTEDGVCDLLRRGGLVEVSATTLRWEHRTESETWWAAAASEIATPGAVLAHQTPAMRERIRVVYDRMTTRYRDGDGLLRLPTAAILASGLVARGK